MVNKKLHYCGKQLPFNLTTVFHGNYVGIEVTIKNYWTCGEGTAGMIIVLCDSCAKRNGLKW